MKKLIWMASLLPATTAAAHDSGQIHAHGTGVLSLGAGLAVIAVALTAHLITIRQRGDD